MAEGVRMVSVWGGSWCEKEQTNHLRCCQGGGATEPPWRTWATTGKEQGAAASLKRGGREEKKGKG